MGYGRVVCPSSRSQQANLAPAIEETQTVQ
jgi:hypothetical protein